MNQAAGLSCWCCQTAESSRACKQRTGQRTRQQRAQQESSIQTQQHAAVQLVLRSRMQRVSMQCSWGLSAAAAARALPAPRQLAQSASRTPAGSSAALPGRHSSSHPHPRPLLRCCCASAS